jgi:hypothetical protein
MIVFACGACAEDEAERASTNFAADVQLTNREPGSACRHIAAVEVRAGRDDLPSAETLRAYAQDRGANYVVIDAFRVCDESEDATVLTQARLFRCPLAWAANLQ